MNVADFALLYSYNDWANDRLAATAAALSPDTFLRDLGSGLRSIRDVVAHIASVEWVWLERWNGASPSAPPGWYSSDDPDTLFHHRRRFAVERRTFLTRLADVDLASTLSFTYFGGKPGSIHLGDALLHVANHSTYHRGQLASLLRRVGAIPPSTDFDVFRAEA